ncbi:putative receptor-like protein kinase At5g24010 [Bidens hawaiensis]|uniref:putative receptor-like protein kinase At5g24010 n=1 Tax=Bidens hawaiensis TaxID=980011 RepID=UPI00404B3564
MSTASTISTISLTNQSSPVSQPHHPVAAVVAHTLPQHKPWQNRNHYHTAGLLPTPQNLSVTINRLDPTPKPAEFLGEVNTLSTLHHPNVVSLIGYCAYEEEHILVYEYVPGGTLENHLHNQRDPLSWLHRLDICIGVACGLRYLHGLDSGVLHGNIASWHIPLDENRVPKLSNFGLFQTCLKEPADMSARRIHRDVGRNFMYLDPMFYVTGYMKLPSDVYSFGLLLLEVLGRKPVLGFDRIQQQRVHIAEWFEDLIVDPKRMVEPSS